MNRATISFDEFEKEFINKPKDGYYSVHASYAEDDESNPLKIIQLDMICEWRLDDGKVKFLSIPYESDEQLFKIFAYLEVTASMLYSAIKENIEKLTQNAPSKLIKGLIFEVDGRVRHTFTSFQKAREAFNGGFAEGHTFSDQKAIAYLDEDGKAKSLATNKCALDFFDAYKMGFAEFDIICGPMIVVGMDDEGNEIDVPDTLVSTAKLLAGAKFSAEF